MHRAPTEARAQRGREEREGAARKVHKDAANFAALPSQSLLHFHHGCGGGLAVPVHQGAGQVCLCLCVSYFFVRVAGCTLCLYLLIVQL